MLDSTRRFQDKLAATLAPLAEGFADGEIAEVVPFAEEGITSVAGLVVYTGDGRAFDLTITQRP